MCSNRLESYEEHLLLTSTCPIWLSGKLISHIFRETEVFLDAEWERYFCYENIVVPDVYTGPHLAFPLTVSNVTDLVEAFKQKQVGPSMSCIHIIIVVINMA